MKSLFFVLSILIAAPSFALGVFTFGAKVVSFDKESITVAMEDQSKLKVPRKDLNPEQEKGLKAGKKLTLTLPESKIAEYRIQPKK